MAIDLAAARHHAKDEWNLVLCDEIERLRAELAARREAGDRLAYVIKTRFWAAMNGGPLSDDGEAKSAIDAWRSLDAKEGT